MQLARLRHWVSLSSVTMTMSHAADNVVVKKLPGLNAGFTIRTDDKLSLHSRHPSTVAQSVMIRPTLFICVGRISLFVFLGVEIYPLFPTATSQVPEYGSHRIAN